MSIVSAARHESVLSHSCASNNNFLLSIVFQICVKSDARTRTPLQCTALNGFAEGVLCIHADRVMLEMFDTDSITLHLGAES